MKANIHPEYMETSVSCACGAVYKTRSTKQDMRIGICGVCHPFFTGQQKFVDTAGRVDKFRKRFGTATAAERMIEKKAEPKVEKKAEKKAKKK
ncbi:MAG: 50S ribosomal protein L31 [bacterium]